jgi:glycosyltransferase involved in cell wall biosynthesis
MTEKSPIVTVIIPTYNSSDTLKLSLETVLRQDFTDYEIWVIGDCCSDDSEAVVMSFCDKRVQWINLSVNSGTPSMPRNEGLRRARGKYIAYLGHDDLWFPWHLSQLVDCIERNKSDFVYSLGALLGPEGVIGTFSLPKKAWHSQERISPCNWLHRTNLIESIGLWSPSIKFGDDRNFLHRLFAANLKFDFLKQLSVLKYPASVWRMYSLTMNFPQSKHVEAMRKNAEELRLELLLEIATVISQQKSSIGQQKSRLPKPLFKLLRLIINAYGQQHWPLNKLMYWRWRRKTGLAEKQRN